jgi:hypothetical protein
MTIHRTLTGILALAAVTGLVFAQDAPPKKAPASPAAEATATLGGKAVTIKYSAPSVKGRKIFGAKDVLLPDGMIWRAGANQATALHTEGDITIGDVKVPAGDYTLYIELDPKAWVLLISKQKGQWGIGRDGTTFDKTQELGRVTMKMNPVNAPIETFKISIDAQGAKGTVTFAWETKSASAPIAAAK